MKPSSIHFSVIFFSLCLGQSLAKHFYHDLKDANQLAVRSRRAPADNDCRYDKGPWQECDPLNGMQKRALKLREVAQSATGDCLTEKFIERPCKKQCKYAKGTWTDCKDGSKERVDKLKTEVSTAGCKPEKQISKPCKKQCSYEKSEWSACENGIKSKTLTLVEGANSVNNPDCEAVKKINKPCAKGAKGKRFRKKNREQNDG